MNISDRIVPTAVSDSQVAQHIPDNVSNAVEASQPTQVDDAAQSVQKVTTEFAQIYLSVLIVLLMQDITMLLDNDWDLQDTQLCENTCNVLDIDESPISQEEINMDKDDIRS